MRNLYKTNEVAQEFRVSAATVKRWVREGKLKCFKTLGGHYRFTEEAVQKLKEEM